MGKYSNIILTSDHGTIFDAIRRVDEEMSSVREVMPGRLYRLPPAQDKTAADDFETFADSSDTATAKAILNTLSGFSRRFAKPYAEAPASIRSGKRASWLRQNGSA